MDHLRVAPPMMAPAVRRVVGVLMSGSLLLIIWRGEIIAGDQARDSIKRREYAAVRAVARNRSRRISEFVGFIVESSRIVSFE